MIVPGLFLGAYVDADDGTLQNPRALADDVSQALPDDEDSLVNPAGDLALTSGAQPTVSVSVTNITGTAATLWGWIDYNHDGLFDNATERAQATVANGLSGAAVTLTFPAVPRGYTGPTYARFRLSTDPAAANATGAAADGEVEDYLATLTAPSVGVVGSTGKIASGIGGGPTLLDKASFGNAVTAIGDLDGDGVNDLAVGAHGAVHDRPRFAVHLVHEGRRHGQEQDDDRPRV